ncbi:MAG: hypothetical protein ACW99Q_14685 [Candidatus Kariarchaeaceae archaeon]
MNPPTPDTNNIETQISQVMQKGTYNLLSYPKLFPMIQFVMSERGPEVAVKDFEVLPKKLRSINNINELFQKLAVNYIFAIGDGQIYNEGVFEVPAGILEVYRIMLICFRYENPNYGNDPRLKSGYSQLAMFIPKSLLLSLPNFYSLEKQILKFIKKQKSFEWDSEDLKNSKMGILEILKNSLR